MAKTGSRSRIPESKLFFDRPAVIDAVGRAKARVLGRQGALVRLIAMQSIRQRKRISSPGEPPSSHSGLLKQFLYYSFDPSAKSVVVGPSRLAILVGYVVPQILEFGGTVAVRRHGQRIVQRFRARPYMRPALDRAKDRLAGYWRDQVRR